MPSARTARRLYRGFREAKPSRTVRVAFVMPKALFAMGTVDAIEYTTTHGSGSKRRAQPYRHDFAPGSKPLLIAGTQEGQLFLLRGRFKVTARGIVDLSPRRRQILD